MTGLMREMTGLERLRELAEAIKQGRRCVILHRHFGDGPIGCGNRRCVECEGDFIVDLSDQIERETAHDPSKDVSMSAYDLLPECDRKAISLALDCGGVEEIKKRLMPEGMEWPRFETGEPVRVGDVAVLADNEQHEVESMEFFADKSCKLKGKGTPWMNTIFKGQVAKRPAPKVLDADEVEIRVGDTVYLLPGEWCDKSPLYRCHGWDEMEVINIAPVHNSGRIECKTLAKAIVCYPQPSQLTHRAPVLAADGKPLREGEHVYHVETGAELVVKELPKPGEYQAVVVFAPPASHLTSFDPDQLTHERPDSWERLEEDADKNPFDYCKDVGHRLDTCENSEAYKARDLVRRAKKLAGVE